MRSSLLRAAVPLLLALCAAPASAQLGFSKSFSPDEIGPGGVSELTYTITNPSGTAATNVAFVDVLPAGMTLASPAFARTDMRRDPVLSAPDGGTTVTLSDGMIEAGATRRVTVLVTSATPGSFPSTSGDLTSSLGNSGTATDDLDVDPDLPGLSLSFSPPAVDFGQRTTLTMTFDNSLGVGDVIFLNATVELPPGLVVANPQQVVNDCVQGGFDGGIVEATPGQSRVVLRNTGGSIAVVPAGAVCSVSVDVLALAAGELIAATSLSQGTPPASPPEQLGFPAARLSVAASPGLALSIGTDVRPLPGGRSSLVLDLRNPSRTDALSGLSLTVDLDAALSGLAASGLPLSDVCGAGSQLSGTSLLSLTGGTLAAGAACRIEVPLAIPAGAAPGSYTVSSSALSSASGVVAAAASAELVLTAGIELELAFLDAALAPDPLVTGGDDVVLRCTLTNLDLAQALTDVSLEIALAPGLPNTVVTSLPSDPCGVGSSLTRFFSTQQNTLDLALFSGSLGAGETCSFDVTITLPANTSGGTYEVRAAAPTATGVGRVVGNPATASLEVRRAPLVRMELLGEAVPGATVPLRFTLFHPGEAVEPATDVAFSVDLDAALPGLVAVNTPLADVCGVGSALLGTSLLVLDGGSLGPDELCTFTVDVAVPAGAAAGTVTITTSEITAQVAGITAKSRAASSDVLVGGLILQHAFLGAPLAGEPGTVTLRYTLENRHPSDDATDIFFSHALQSILPGAPDLTVVPPLPSAPCGAGSTLTGTTSLVLVGGSLAAGSSCSFDVILTVPAGAAPGAYTSATGNLSAMIGGASVVFPQSSAPFILEDPQSAVVLIDAGGDLVFSDGASRSNALNVRVDGADLVISDPGILLFTAIEGATGDGTNSLRIPLAAIGGGLQALLTGDSDEITLDFSGGAFPFPISIDGGAGTDRLLLSGAAAARMRLLFVDETSGSIEVDGTVISYTGLE